MPDKEVRTIRDLIFYQYAKIIGNSSLWKDAKKNSYGFVKNKFKQLRDDEITRSTILREDKQMLDEEKKCVYCWATEDLSRDHIVAKSLKINERCATCDRIQWISNHIRACKSCNSKKSDRGLYHFFKSLNPNEPKYYDHLPPLLEKKYLKTIYCCHLCKGDLDKTIEDISVLDLDL